MALATEWSAAVGRSWALSILWAFIDCEQEVYADDTLAYLHCPSITTMGAARTMHQAMGALAGWMSSNRLRLNAQKTKFIW